MADLIKPIQVAGLRELQAALKAIDGEAQKELRTTLNTVAELVAVGARSRAPVKSGKLRASIRVLSTQREARVAEGSARVPYAGFIDYGGTVSRGHRASHGAKGRRVSSGGGVVRRPFIKGGRILYPAYYADQERILATLNAALNDLIEKHGLKVDA